MSKPISKAIYKIAQTNSSTRIVLFTQYLKIDGEIILPEKACDQCHEDILTLTNALVCRLKDYCECDGEDCDCHDYVCFRYDWLNVNIDGIVAFSILK